MHITPGRASSAASPTARDGGATPARGHILSHFLPRTVRSRLALTQVGLVVGVLMVLGIYLAVAGRQLYVDRLAEQLAAQAQIVAAAVAPSLDAGERIEAVDPLVKRLGERINARVTVVAADGSVLGDSVADPRTMDNHGARPEVVVARQMGIGEAERHSATLDADFLYVAVPIPGVAGAVARVALPLHDVDAAVSRIRRDVAYATAIASAAAVTVA
jgi:two-component system, OmpR family, phosphate regulon sensor histidine kinase PhoR